MEGRGEPTNPAEPTPSFEDRLNSSGMRYAYQVSYSTRLLGDICERYQQAQDADDPVPALALLDAFYVHLRLLAEFLTRETKDFDFGPATFGVEWSCPKTEAARRLKGYWHDASKYVVHFGHARVPDEVSDLEPFDVSAPALRRMAADALKVLNEFIVQVEENAPGGSMLLVSDLQAQELRQGYDHASERLG